jgi:hypothetical protein
MILVDEFKKKWSENCCVRLVPRLLTKDQKIKALHRLINLMR